MTVNLIFGQGEHQVSSNGAHVGDDLSHVKETKLRVSSYFHNSFSSISSPSGGI